MKRAEMSDTSSTEQPKARDGSSSEASEFNDGYGEDLMGDEEDRKRLAAMSEKDREQELFERAERREVLKNRFRIQQKLRTRRKNPDMSLLRTTERTKKINKVDAFAELKAAREEKLARARGDLLTSDSGEDEEENNDDDDDGDGQEVGEKKEEGERGKFKVPKPKVKKSVARKPAARKHRKRKYYSSASSSSDSDENSRNPRKQPIKSVQELNSMRLTRLRCEKWVHMPFFDGTVTGCFVRVNIGAHPTNGKRVYRVGEIVDVQEMPNVVYDLGTTKTNKAFLLRSGDEERIFRMEFLSNQDFSEAEFAKWVETMKSARLKLPTKEELTGKISDLNKYAFSHFTCMYHLASSEMCRLVNSSAAAYRMTEADVNHVIKEKVRLGAAKLNVAAQKKAIFLEKLHTPAKGALRRYVAFPKSLVIGEGEAQKSEQKGSWGLRSDPPKKKKKDTTANVPAGEQQLTENVEEPEGRQKNKNTARRATRVIAQTRQDMLITSTSEAEGLLPLPVVEDGHPVEDLYDAHDFEVDIDVSQQASRLPNFKMPPITVCTMKNYKPPPKGHIDLNEYKRQKGFM